VIQKAPLFLCEVGKAERAVSTSIRRRVYKLWRVVHTASDFIIKEIQFKYSLTRVTSTVEDAYDSIHDILLYLIEEKSSPIYRQIDEVRWSIWGIITTAIEWLGSGGGAILAWVRDRLREVWGWTKMIFDKVFTGVWDRVKIVLSGVWDAIKQLAKFFTDLITAVEQKIKKVADWILKKLGLDIDILKRWVEGQITAFFARIKEAIKKVESKLLYEVSKVKYMLTRKIDVVERELDVARKMVESPEHIIKVFTQGLKLIPK